MTRDLGKIFKVTKFCKIMSYYIVIRGPPAVGKSTISEILAKRLDAFHISMDRMRRKHNCNFTEKEKLLALEKTLPEAISKLKKGKIVIFNEVFYYSKQIECLKVNLPYKGFIFNLFAPLSYCKKRNKGRMPDGLKDESRVVEVYDLVNKFDYGIKIDTTDKTIDETIKEIISHLPKLE